MKQLENHVNDIVCARSESDVEEESTLTKPIDDRSELSMYIAQRLTKRSITAK